MLQQWILLALDESRDFTRIGGLSVELLSAVESALGSLSLWIIHLATFVRCPSTLQGHFSLPQTLFLHVLTNPFYALLRTPAIIQGLLP